MKKVLLVIVAAVVAAPTLAADADTPKRGGFCISTASQSADSLFQCEHLGKVTIRQIYEKGWRVVHKQDVKGTAGAVELIIEEQR